MGKEYELRFLETGDLDTFRENLKRIGFDRVRPETLMKRETFHFPKDHPEHHSKWGRVRDEGDQITATVKWYENPNNPKISDIGEDEIIVKTWDAGLEWISDQGFTPTAYQESKRESWKLESIDGDVIADIDTWPGLSPQIEIESYSEEVVILYAGMLGLNLHDSMAGGVEFVYEKILGIDKTEFKAMQRITFDDPPKKKNNKQQRSINSEQFDNVGKLSLP